MQKNQFQLRLIQVICFVMFCQVGFSQTPPPLRENYTYSNWRIAIARWQINSLADGVLLVRLKYNQSAVDQLREAGNDKYADRIEEQQNEVNSALIQAFREQFDFCDVYFFKSEHSNLVREHKLDSIPFVAKHVLNPEDDFIDASTPFLVAELGTLAPDTLKQKDYYQPQFKRDNNSVGYHSNSNLGLPALIFKSDQFVQLNEPFPYYVRTYGSIDFIVDKSTTKVIAKANERLHAFNGRPYVEAKERNAFKVAKRSTYRDSDLNKYRLAINGGYGVRLSNEIFTQGKGGSEYEKSLKNGYVLGADLDYFFSKHFGIGLSYSFNHFSGEKSSEDLSENIFMHYMGPKFTARVSEGKQVYLASVGGGYSLYRNDLEEASEVITVRGDAFALSIDIGCDFDLSNHFGLGIQFGIKTGFMEDGQIKLPNERETSSSFPGGEGITRFEIKAGIRLK